MAIVPCSVSDCEALTGMKGTARGLCSKHYNRLLRNGDPNIRTQRVIIERCTFGRCDKPHDAKGLCTAHLTNLRRHGEPQPRKRGEVVDGHKICADCGDDRPVSDFYVMGGSPQARCKPCSAIKTKAYRQSRIDTVREQSRLSAAKRPLQRRDAARKRRAALRAATVEDVSSIAVMERGGWVCGICRNGIPRVTLWPHPQSPSLDHIVALARGGDHSYANTQPAHLACNMSKGDRMAE